MPERSQLKIFLSGDVMTGRGIDQILKHPAEPQIYESYIQDARDYVLLAERINGKIPRFNHGDYLWSDALKELNRRQPDVSLINLETSVTSDGHPCINIPNASQKYCCAHSSTN
ncbi:capsule biosynthesis protein [Legionella sainthelensi]|uniref:Capsule biosynthesis protein n=1 Tax=Legionella sainthelensi TaxID=28087 RepID=A0A0W0YKJ4_9GAMM|nr:capsule biosynthesis protein [Legionella sainthelensi]VEH37597.1 capsule biosynthesis protein [Legionella sainthelensi]